MPCRSLFSTVGCHGSAVQYSWQTIANTGFDDRCKRPDSATQLFLAGLSAAVFRNSLRM